MQYWRGTGVETGVGCCELPPSHHVDPAGLALFCNGGVKHVFSSL